MIHGGKVMTIEQVQDVHSQSSAIGMSEDAKDESHNLDDPSTWTKNQVFAELSAQGIRRNDYPEREYEKAKRFLLGYYHDGWVEEDSDYDRLIGWVCEWVGL